MPVGESKHLLLEKLVASYAQTRNQKKKNIFNFSFFIFQIIYHEPFELKNV